MRRAGKISWDGIRTQSARGTVENPGEDVRKKARLNRAVRRLAYGNATQFMRNKNQEYPACVAVESNPAYSSLTCPKCLHCCPENRPTRDKFKCVACGYEAGADFVGALNNLREGKKLYAQGLLRYDEPKRRKRRA